MRARSLAYATALSVAGLGAFASCNVDRHEATTDISERAVNPAAFQTSSQAHSRIEVVRDRFRTTEAAPQSLRGERAQPKSIPVLGPAIATGFEPGHGGGARAVIPAPSKLGVERTASVDLPIHANAMATIEDDATHLRIGFALRNAVDAAITTADGIAVYPAALGGNDVFHRVSAEGTEDFVVFETRPDREEIVYDVDVSRAAGLRLASNTLEFLDDGGTPRLRVAPPYVVDAEGTRAEAKIAIDDCAFDTSSEAPWGRAVTAPRAPSCIVRIAWEAKVYPAIVDPTWVSTGSMVTARAALSMTRLPSGKVLVAGGDDAANFFATAELYDPTTGTFAVTGSMAAKRIQHTATLLNNGKVLIAGGYDGSGYLAGAELYNPATGTFAATGSMVKARSSFAAVLLGSGKVLAAAGFSSGSILASAEVYDPAAGTFAATGSLATMRYYHTGALLLSGKALIVGGDSGGGTLATAEVYDPAAGTFAATGSLTTARESHTMTLLPSGKVLVAGGVNNVGDLASAELYDPAGAGNFAATGSLATARWSDTATLLGSGKVLIVGGTNAAMPVIGTAEIFDPAAGTFAPAGSLASARYQQGATLLQSGKVLVAGGLGSFAALSNAEIFNLSGGAACAIGADCVSGVCEDGICCSGPCSGACKTCTAGTGACVAVTNADDPDSCTGANTCDPIGACKKKIGQTCPGGNSDCANAQCADGRCCNTACSGSCDVCAAGLGAAADGTCSTAPAGYAGNPVCGNGFACDGASVACPASCSADIDCQAGYYCSANGTCQTQKAQGDACNAAAGADCTVAGCHDCLSGNCVDGVCCDTACKGLCQACAAALKESGVDGVCDNAKAQTNPHNDNCPVDDPSTCGHDGLCSGSGACSLHYPAGTSCGNSMCVAGNKVAGDVCDGNGTCAANPAGIACGEFLCANASCPSKCAADADCIASAYCKQGTCLSKEAAGATCATGSECASTFCADGVCCNSTCTGQCEACNIAATKGTCTPVVGAPVPPRAACAAGDAEHPCASARCDGKTTTSCTGFVGSAVACRAESCVGGEQTLSATCDGKGECPAADTKLCAPYSCNANACATSCAVDGDCSAGGQCVDKKCVSGASCAADGHTLVDPAGTPKDCAPYVCAKNACSATCASVDDCFAPNICDATNHCVAPASSVPGSGESGGCAFAPTPRGIPSRGAAFFLALGILVAVRRRRESATCVETRRRRGVRFRSRRQ